MTWWCGDIGRRQEREETTPVVLTRILLSYKIKKINAANLAATYGR
jgi:hypothetical protein